MITVSAGAIANSQIIVTSLVIKQLQSRYRSV